MKKSFWERKIKGELAEDVAKRKALNDKVAKLEKMASEYEPGNDDSNDFCYDDSEQFLWEHEHKQRCAERGIYYAPTNFSECYEPEIMGRPNGYLLKD